MIEKNKIRWIDFDFDLENILPDELIESLGLTELSLESLLDYIKQGAFEVEEAWNTRRFSKPEGMEAYHLIGRRYAPIAFAVYDRLFKKGQEPRLSTYLAVNRFKSTQSHPDTVIFWCDPDAIKGLYECLEKDGYYEEHAISF